MALSTLFFRGQSPVIGHVFYSWSNESRMDRDRLQVRPGHGYLRDTHTRCDSDYQVEVPCQPNLAKLRASLLGACIQLVSSLLRARAALA